MANAEHVELLLRGVDVWNDWRAKEPSIAPDLSEADLRRAHLKQSEPLLGCSNLRGAKFQGANFGRANLRGADFGEDLREIDLRADYGFASDFGDEHLAWKDEIRVADLGPVGVVDHRVVRGVTVVAFAERPQRMTGGDKFRLD